MSPKEEEFIEMKVDVVTFKFSKDLSLEVNSNDLLN